MAPKLREPLTARHLCAVRAINSGLAMGFTAQCIRSELLDTPGGNCWTPTAVCK